MNKNTAINAVKGFEDLFGPESDVFTHIETVAREVFFRYGYTELRTPILEPTELFCRGIGTETDVVQKEMYTFKDKGDRSVTMRPEATAGVMRACIEHSKVSQDTVLRLFTTGPMFRYERPQKGRLRQFHQINCECLGTQEPFADAELMIMAMRFLNTLGLTDLALHINGLGCSECRPAYREKLRAWLREHDTTQFCESCQRRIETNPLRVLDCKVPTCKEMTMDAPRIVEHNCPDCTEHFNMVKRLMEGAGVPFVLDHRLVRGLDYYVRTTFEVISNSIGAQGTVIGGGRYDGLIAELGGPEVSGVGYAGGIERLAMLVPSLEPKRPDFYLAVLEPENREKGFGLVQTLRDAGLTGEMGFTSRSMKSSMRQAGKSTARYTLILGTDEAANNTVMVKNMDSGEQAPQVFAAVAEQIKGRAD